MLVLLFQHMEKVQLKKVELLKESGVTISKTRTVIGDTIKSVLEGQL